MIDLRPGILQIFAEAARVGRRYKSISLRFGGELSPSFRPHREPVVDVGDLPKLEQAAKRELAVDAAERAERGRQCRDKAEVREWYRAYYRKNRKHLRELHKSYKRRDDAILRSRRMPAAAIEPIAPVSVSTCVCGATIEVRLGCPRPLHIGICTRTKQVKTCVSSS